MFSSLWVLVKLIKKRPEGSWLRASGKLSLGITTLTVKGKIPFVSSFAENTVGKGVQLTPVDEEVLGKRGLSLGCREEAPGYSLGC